MSPARVWIPLAGGMLIFDASRRAPEAEPKRVSALRATNQTSRVSECLQIRPRPTLLSFALRCRIASSLKGAGIAIAATRRWSDQLAKRRAGTPTATRRVPLRRRTGDKGPREGFVVGGRVALGLCPYGDSAETMGHARCASRSRKGTQGQGANRDASARCAAPFVRQPPWSSMFPQEPVGTAFLIGNVRHRGCLWSGARARRRCATTSSGTRFADVWCSIPKIVFSRTLDSV
jgi:hypothetical protein